MCSCTTSLAALLRGKPLPKDGRLLGVELVTRELVVRKVIQPLHSEGHVNDAESRITFEGWLEKPQP